MLVYLWCIVESVMKYAFCTIYFPIVDMNIETNSLDS